MPEQGPANTNYRIGVITAAMMLFLAASIDVLQVLTVVLNFIPGLGVVAGLFLGYVGSFAFFLWFFLKGLNYFEGRRALVKILTSLSALVIESILFLDALPMATITVAYMVFAARAEDREKAEKAAEEAKRVARPARILRMPTPRAANDEAPPAREAA